MNKQLKNKLGDVILNYDKSAITVDRNGKAERKFYKLIHTRTYDSIEELEQNEDNL